MTTFVKKLHQLYLQKKRILENLKEKYAEHIRHIVKEPAYAYTEEERNSLEDHRLASLISRIFHHGSDLIFLLNEVVAANAQLKHYNDEADDQSLRDNEGIDVARNIEALQDAEIMNLYIGLMQHVDKEQRYLIEVKMALSEIMERRDWQDWIKHLMKFNIFLKELEQGILSFHKLLEKLVERWHLEKRKQDDNIKHRFLVRGTYFYGKLRQGTTEDFQTFQVDGELINYGDVISQANFLYPDLTSKVYIYRPEGEDYMYGYEYYSGFLDRAGRRGHEVVISKTSTEMNPYEYLLTLAGIKNVGVQVDRNFSPSPPFEKYQFYEDDIKSHRIQVDTRIRLRMNQVTLIHFQPGSYVYSPPEARQKAYEEGAKGYNANEIIATLIYGENAFVGPEGLAAISKKTEMLPYIRWMGFSLYPIEMSRINFDSINRDTLEIGQQGVFDFGEQYRGRRSKECNDFVNKFIIRFGNSDVKIQILYESLRDLKMRRLFVQCLLERKFELLDSTYRPALEWLEIVGTSEEIREARIGIERQKIEVKPQIEEIKPSQPIPPPEKPPITEVKPEYPVHTPISAEVPAKPQAVTPAMSTQFHSDINFEILNQIVAKCRKPKEKIIDLNLTEEEIRQLELASTEAERIMTELISKAHPVDRDHLNLELHNSRTLKFIADRYKTNPASIAHIDAFDLIGTINSIIDTLQSFRIGENEQLIEQPVNIEIIDEIMRRCSERRAVVGKCIKSKREARQIGVSASQAEIIITDLISKAAQQDERSKLNTILENIKAVKALSVLYLRGDQKFLNGGAETWAKPLKDVIDVLKSNPSN